MHAKLLEPGPTRSFGWRWGIALLSVAAAFVSTLLLQHLFPYPFLFFFFGAVMASAWFGGTGPGFFAVLISTVVVDYFFCAALLLFLRSARRPKRISALLLFAPLSPAGSVLPRGRARRRSWRLATNWRFACPNERPSL